MRFVLRLFGFALTVPSLCGYAQTPQQLPALNIDITQTSVSGLSSGGYMAVQLAVAYSSIVKGAGVVAAGPYFCSQGKLLTAMTQCSCNPPLPCGVSATSTAVPSLVLATRQAFARKLIDDPAKLAGQLVITISGQKDTTVPQAVVQQLADYYRTLGLPPAGLSEVSLDNAGHTMPTLNYGVACGDSVSPFIGKCQFDGAKAILGWIYGPAPLKPRTGSAPTGHFVQFDQTAFLPKSGRWSVPGAAGLDSTGWVYIPEDCKAGARCRLHVALHGCEQGQDYVPVDSSGSKLYYGTTFVKHAGYERWADNNQIVVLYPQAVVIPVTNPLGCWDWWGYTDSHFADRKGVQMQAIRAMIDRLSSGANQ
ncbi:extracellular catalytic domain type 2 short-chain-length polyhydroxyalkanoate depolymerase [Paraburkholderia sp. HD33-4]|uniref:extracellular catalytic domain type 2 short-chain-length polyhydroxyalkanoate depolymerase n=1 Tax=Paraburkholderia sp. HD33-4 TaxID=2883242 RepID=UPI001F31D38B|nr:poly(3-hydroxybutyrate) depolymerase [Paraburkholderia sp. HD33-4]